MKLQHSSLYFRSYFHFISIDFFTILLHNKSNIQDFHTKEVTALFISFTKEEDDFLFENWPNPELRPGVIEKLGRSEWICQARYNVLRDKAKLKVSLEH